VLTHAQNDPQFPTGPITKHSYSHEVVTGAVAVAEAIAGLPTINVRATKVRDKRKVLIENLFLIRLIDILMDKCVYQYDYLAQLKVQVF